jgi:orotate phosphoribosyltransferase-like protein
MEQDLAALRVDQVADMLEMQEMGMTRGQIATICRVSRQYVWQVLKREN